MNEQDCNKVLDSSLDNLPREMRPPRDLWTGIDHAIELHESDRNLSMHRVFQVAAVVMVVIGSVWFFSIGLDPNKVNSSEVNLAMFVEDMDKGFTMQKANMLSVYEGQVSFTSNWRDQLQELEVARMGIREALKSNPNNVYMIQILQNIQRQQLDLIERVHTPINRNI